MKAKFATAIAILGIAANACATTDQAHLSKSDSAGPPDSVLVDKEGNKYPIRILADSKLWMTANLNLNIPDSYCYENAAGNCAQYGRLYTWESARQGCRSLGEGWRLPTSGEWEQLTKLYGGMAVDSNVLRKGALSAGRR